MKKISPEIDDWLEREYERSELGELVRGKYARTQVEFAEFAGLLIACVGEDESIRFERETPGNYGAGHKSGDWTYEIDESNQITLRYWLSDFGSIDEPLKNITSVTTPEERSKLQAVLQTQVRLLKDKVSKLNSHET